jgi:hypothetical protein
LIKKIKVKLSFQALHPWNTADHGLRLLKLLQDYGDVDLSPSRFGSSEARTFPFEDFDTSRIEEIWMRVGGGTIKGPRPWNMLVSIFYVEGRMGTTISRFTLWLAPKFFEDPNRVTRFLQLCKEIYVWGSMDHGYVTHESEYEAKNSLGPASGVGGPNLKYALPGIYWANFFGPVYAKWLGDEKFESMETFHKEKLPDGGWLLVTRPNVLEYEGAALRMHETEIIHVLGREAFFEIDDPDKETITPSSWERSV